MKMKTLVLPVSLALVLAACGTSAPQHRGHGGHGHGGHGHGHGGHAHQHDRGHQHPEEGRPLPNKDRFSCQNGLSVFVRQMGNDRVELRLDDKRTVMTAAVSGSGERYTSSSGLFGSGAEWHQKGKEAFFSFKDPYGNAVETVCRSAE